MKVTVDIECTPVEARTFLGLPDISGLNDHLVEQMKTRMDENMSALQPDELMKTWMAFGGQAQEGFMKMMTNAAGINRGE